MRDSWVREDEWYSFASNPRERGVRVLGGLALLSLLAVGPVPGWGLLGLAGLIFVATGLAGSCPIYTLVGFSTRGADGDEEAA